MREGPPQTVLIDSADPHRRETWRAALRRIACVPLEAATVGEARAWMQAICPDLVLADAALPDGRAVAVLQEWRRVPALERVPVMVRGAVTAAEQRWVARDPHAWVHQGDDPYALRVLLEEILHAA